MNRHPYLAGHATPRVIAHRGFVPDALAAAGVAENTRAAFTAAWEAGARYLETDCHLTRDGIVVLAHDPDLTRVAGDPRRIADLTHRELVDVFSSRGGLLTLAEALAAFPEACWFVDVKAPAAAAPVARAIAHHGDRVLLASFDERTRRRTLKLAAELGAAGDRRPATAAGSRRLVKMVLATWLGAHSWQDRLFAGIDAIQIPLKRGLVPVFTRRLVRAAHDRGVEVHVWTINDVDTMRRVRALRADGIITDRADAALRALHPQH